MYKPECPRCSQMDQACMSRPAVHWYSLMSSGVAQGSCSSPTAGSCHLMFTPLITPTTQQASLPPHSVTPHCTQSNPPLQREVLWRALVPLGRLSVKPQSKSHSVVTAGQGAPNCEPLRNTNDWGSYVGVLELSAGVAMLDLLFHRGAFTSFIRFHKT